jgi:hypothetical protein
MELSVIEEGGVKAADERRRPHFGLFDTRDAAREWLGR